MFEIPGSDIGIYKETISRRAGSLIYDFFIVFLVSVHVTEDAVNGRSQPLFIHDAAQV
jgi:hypothetical protein